MTNKINTKTKYVPVLGTAMGAALFGAVIGGTAAAAKGMREVKAGRATGQEVGASIAREAGSTAVAVGAATAVVGALSLGPFLSTLGIAALATGSKYAMDSLLQGKKPEPALAGPAQSQTAASAVKADTGKKAAARKTAAKKSPAKKAATKKAAPKKTTSSKTAKAKTGKSTPKTETDKA
ncbi:magnetosome protein MamC [Desulfovibrio sp. Huiquan2017]|uniref:magnetosome protein MamC n=1 Tax=Desulfovibrio sp. Huiquan2017 TaxID=2816861 RepID=UPI001A91BC0B|nr:magnetosome protein MamC [Desulfovibrio sp. Huiquan2017]